MKNIISVLLTIFLFLLFTGCSEDFVDRTPTTSSVIQTFYKTPENGAAALTAVYNMILRDDWWSQYIYSEIASDNCAGGAGTGDGGGFQRLDRGLTWPEQNAHQDLWKTYFGGICRANIYLKYESRINWSGKENLQKEFIAEARFLRAYYHFYLTKFFGEIPAIKDLIKPGEIPSRTPGEELYTFILDDLKFCIENGITDMNADNWGRANKWAAEAMFARVFMFYSGYYNKTSAGSYTASDARKYLDDIIQSNKFQLVDTFARLWIVPAASTNASYVGEMNSEVIWSVRYGVTGPNSYGGALFQRMIGPRMTNTDPYGQGWGAMPVLPSLWNLYDSTDTRRNATILNWDKEGKVYDYVSNQQAQYTGYNLKKYELLSKGNNVDPSLKDWQTDGYEDYMIVRYADVLLMAAELYLDSDKSKALEYVNKVRERAYGNSNHNLTADKLNIDAIFKERRLEFVGENMRYWDILRSCKGDFSKLKDILTYNDTSDDGDYSESIDMNSLDVNGANFSATKGLFQIPQNEIDLMEGIIQQNPRE